jgi:hypothetical protein
MTKKQPPMPIIDRDTLYAALYTPLDDNENETRTNTLKTLLGVDKNGLIELIARYKMENNASQIIETNKKDNKDTDTTVNDFGDIVNYWQALHDLYVCYLKALETRQKRTQTPINKILIYEAPPMPNATDKKGKKGKKGQINYILAESCKHCVKSKNCNDNFQIPPSGPYFDTIKGLVENPKSQTIQEILVDQGILFIDLCPLPLPMTTDIRKDVWGEKLDEIDDKPLSLVLLELALKFALENGVQITENPIIAMGTPTATSQSIYYYFESKKSCFKKPVISIDRNTINFSKLLETNKKYVEKWQILPLYASNIIAGSNTPNADLLQRIF